MPRIRIHFISRGNDGSDSLGGFIDESHLFECPHWIGIAGSTHQEILIRFRWHSEENQTIHEDWLCYFKAIKPDRECFSSPDEREDLKQYVDANSHVLTYTDSEAIAWFQRHGREMPGKEIADPKAALPVRVEAALEALIPQFRHAFANPIASEPWAVVHEANASSFSIGHEERVVSALTMYVGCVRIGDAEENRWLHFNLHTSGSKGEDEELDRFKSLASRGASFIISEVWTKRLRITEWGANRIALWLTFLLHFGPAERQGKTYTIRSLYACSIRAIDGAIAQPEKNALSANTIQDVDVDHHHQHKKRRRRRRRKRTTSTNPREVEITNDRLVEAVTLRGRNKPALVNGNPKELNATQYAAISALLKARPNGLTLSSLRKNSSQDARGILTRMRENDPDWAAVIHMAGAPYGRYRID